MSGEPTQAADPHSSLVVVASFSEPMAAELAALHLLQAGIAAQLLDANLMPADPLLQFAIGGVKVAVAAADAASAQQLLAQHRQQVSVVKCPDCGSSNVERHRGGQRAAWLTMLCLGFPIGRARGRSRCRDCQCAWRG